jgi:hypothetical protein
MVLNTIKNKFNDRFNDQNCLFIKISPKFNDRMEGYKKDSIYAIFFQTLLAPTIGIEPIIVP